MGKKYDKIFGIRCIFCFFFIVLLMFISALRIYRINFLDYQETAKAQSSFSLEVAKYRGVIYDCNLVPMVGNTSKYVAAVPPTPKAAVGLRKLLSGERLQQALQRLEGGKPILVDVPAYIETDGIEILSVPSRYKNDQPAAHIIGYLDSSGHGTAGIEAAYDDILYSNQSLTIRYFIDAWGRVLPGAEPEINGITGSTNSGIALTIDLKIQEIVEQAAEKLQTGAVVVLEVGSGKIRAITSKPSFNSNAISESLNNPLSPLFNRALAAYDVGSGFKPLIAAAAIEKGISPNYQYTCTGSIEIGGKVFKCHNELGHGQLNMKSALAVSCNTYFYHLASITGAEALHSMATSLGFGQQRIIARNIVADKGNLTSLEVLKTQPAALANFAIGQGDLLLSPIALASLYEAIANGGVYHAPTIIEGIVENGNITSVEEKAAYTKIMKESTAKFLKECLINVVENGTGQKAKPEKNGAGGKTATAQTGWGGSNSVHGWFNGFFPADNPKYVVIILAENGVSGSQSCAPVFKEIADNINALENN
ncbi:MAG TPA: penicillin-binding protein 2 [Clostridiales bacterium]|nr:penicillin-binding protein 2 [Clostridiales bacterium]